MHNAIRSFCVFLCTALLAVTTIHGVTDVQHSMGHASDWPALALVDIDEASANHADHVHIEPDDTSDDLSGEKVDADGPMGHGHHIGGDTHAALPGTDHPLSNGFPSRLGSRGPGVDSALGQLTGDGPEHPPKRMRTVV